MKWVPLSELPKDLILDGRRVKYKRTILGYIRSGWGRGLWLGPEKTGSGIQPWFPPGGTIESAQHDLLIEL